MLRTTPSNSQLAFCNTPTLVRKDGCRTHPLKTSIHSAMDAVYSNKATIQRMQTPSNGSNSVGV